MTAPPESGPERFQRLVEPLHARARGFARGLCRSTSEGDDLFHEALLRALTKIGGLRDDGAFRYWLYRVIVSCHRNRLRRVAWRRWIPFAEVAEPVAPAPRFDDQLGSAQRARAALATLPVDQREALVLYEIEGWQVDEISLCGCFALLAATIRPTLSTIAVHPGDITVLGLAGNVASVAAVILSLAARHPLGAWPVRLLGHWASLALGGIGGIAAFARAGEVARMTAPDPAARLLLPVIGVISAFLIASWFALWIRRREAAEIE